MSVAALFRLRVIMFATALSIWDDGTLSYKEGENSVTVSGVAAEKVTLRWGENSPEDAEQLAALTGRGALLDSTSECVFEGNGSGVHACL